MNHVYLEETRFDPIDDDKCYRVSVDEKDGVIVYSECCAEKMCETTAILLYEALGKYLADKDKDHNDRASIA